MNERRLYRRRKKSSKIIKNTITQDNHEKLNNQEMLNYQEKLTKIFSLKKNGRGLKILPK